MKKEKNKMEVSHHLVFPFSSFLFYFFFFSAISTGTAIGTGRKNTALILATDANAPSGKACKDYYGGGKTDWFLPSKDELNELYLKRDYIFAVTNESTLFSSIYNSSSQYTPTGTHMVWAQFFYSISGLFNDGDQVYNTKDGICPVRAIRAF